MPKRTTWAQSDRDRSETEQTAAVASAEAFLAELASETAFTEALHAWRSGAPGPAGLREYALIGVLARFHLPPELSHWARQIAADGVSSRDLAEPFLDRYVRASFGVNNQWLGWPTTQSGHMIQRVEVSFPKSWSKKRAMAYLEDRLDGMRRARALPKGKAGRPREPVTAEQDAEKLVEFDCAVAAGDVVVVPGEGPPFKRANWRAALATWLGRAWPHRASTVMRLGLPLLGARGAKLRTLARRRL